MLVIGGGATGAGVALDSQTRGFFPLCDWIIILYANSKFEFFYVFVKILFVSLSSLRNLLKSSCVHNSVPGLKTALVELDDFSSGTSSRSTKLIHGGVRYLQAAIFGLDIEQYRMVKEALFERANLIHCAPHLSYPLPIMLPIYKLVSTCIPVVLLSTVIINHLVGTNIACLI